MSSSTSFGAALTAVGAAAIIALAPSAHALPGAPLPLAPADCDWIIFNTNSVIQQDNGIRVNVAWGRSGGGTGSYSSNGADWQGPVRGGVVTGTNKLDFTINFSLTGGGFGGGPAPADPTNHYTGTIDQNGSASGTTVNNAGVSNGWTIDGGFKCIGRAPAPQPKEIPAPDPAPDPEPAPQPVEKPPTDAVRLLIVRRLIDVQVNVSSIANIAGQCTYDANEVHGLGPAVSRTFDLAPRGSKQLTFLAPLVGQTYRVVVSCRGDFKGQNVEFGHAEQDVSG